MLPFGFRSIFFELELRRLYKPRSTKTRGGPPIFRKFRRLLVFENIFEDALSASHAVRMGTEELLNAHVKSSFALLSFLFSPLLGLVIVLVLPNLVARAEEDAERERMRREEHERQLEQIRALATTLPATADSIMPSSVADELRKLAELRDQGVLTEAEFQEQKALLLKPKHASVHSAPVRPWH